MKLYDLSQPLNQDAPFWPFYPPFEVKYFKRKAEHGVNAQYIQTSNHMGCHLDAPRHFVTGGKTIDQLPLEWLYGDGVIVDLSDVLDELDTFTTEMIVERVQVSLAPSRTKRSTYIATLGRITGSWTGCWKRRYIFGASTWFRRTIP